MRYLLSRQELQEFRKLSDDPARALFIVRFWQRLDPTPLTLENEARRQYWWRVFEANRRFRDSVRDGWMTDQGRIFILLGEPDTEQKDESGGIVSMPGLGARAPARTTENPPANSVPGNIEKGVDNDTAERGLLRWIYRRLPGNHSEPETIFAFTRDDSGEWRLSRNPRNYGFVLPGITAGGDLGTVEASGSGKQPPQPQDIRVTSRLVSGMEQILELLTLSLSEIGREGLLSLDRAEALRVPGPGEVTADIVTSTEFLNRLPVASRIAFFRASPGRTLVRAGASIAPKALYTDAAIPADLSSFFVLYTRFSASSSGTPGAPAPSAGAAEASAAPAGQPAPPVYYANTEDAPVLVTAADAGGEKPLEAWTDLALPPGRYEAGLAVEDAATGQVTSLRETVQVPAFTEDRLALSSVLPVHSVGQGEAGLLPHPRVEPAFRRAEDFGVYFEVYGLTSGQPFTVTSRFFQRDGDAARPIGNPIVRKELTDPAQAWTFPLTKWPIGAFRLEVTVIQGTAQASETLDFSVR